MAIRLNRKRTPKKPLAVMAAASFVFSASVLLLLGKNPFFLRDVPMSKALSITESKSSHPTSSSTHTAIPQDNLWMPSDLRWFDLCGSLNETVIQVASMLQGPSNQATDSSWTPPILHCDQFVRSLPNKTWWYPTSAASPMTVGSRSSSNKRLVHLFLKNSLALVSRLNRGEPVKIVVIGGSMTTGHRDDIEFASQEEAKEGAWPRKLELLLRHIWPKSLITVENLARPGWSQDSWLSSFHVITQEIAPFDLMLAEFAVNDQCDYDKQEVCRKNSNETSHILLNNILSLPNKPAVMLVEMFRLALDNEGDAKLHCGEHRQVLPNSTTWFCPEWWMPQTWREQAVAYNRVPVISYRDAVWPQQDNPPADLGYYWDGLSHPKLNTHIFVAETVTFSFLVLQDIANHTTMASWLGMEENNDDDEPSHLYLPEYTCTNPVTDYSSFDVTSINFPNKNEKGDSWCFQTYSRNKLGWIGSTLSIAPSESLVFATDIITGNDKKVLLTYLKSYRDHMGVVRVWFDDEVDVSWNISAWHKEHTQVPETELIRVLHLPPNKNVTMYVELIRGSAHNATNDIQQDDVFILLGITSC